MQQEKRPEVTPPHDLERTLGIIRGHTGPAAAWAYNNLKEHYAPILRWELKRAPPEVQPNAKHHINVGFWLAAHGANLKQFHSEVGKIVHAAIRNDMKGMKGINLVARAPKGGVVPLETARPQKTPMSEKAKRTARAFQLKMKRTQLNE